MGKGGVEDGAFYEACSECRVVCQTTHGKDLPHAVPRFFKTIVEHSTPSSTNCHLQIPASFIRHHIGMNKKQTFVLVGTQGCEWVMTFNTIGFKAGWKEFSIAYELETGDGIVLSLVAPKRFYANVFDKFGIEKFDTKQPRNRMASPTSKENQVSNSMNGGGCAENQYTPLDSNGTHLHREGKSNGTQHHTAGNSGQNGSHDNRIDKHHLFPNKPVDHEADPSSMCPSSDDSEDSMQVRLAKAVLAKARQKKLKRKMKASCTSTLQAVEGTNTEREGTIVGVEACQNDDKADGRSNVDPTDSPPRNDGTPASVDDAMFENPCEELRLLTDIRASLVVGGGTDVFNVEEVNNLQAESQPGKLLQEEAPLPQTATAEGVPLRGVESDDPAEDQPSPRRGAESNNPAEDQQPIPLRGAESNSPAGDQPIPLGGAESKNPAEERPIPLFIPGLVKPEPDLSPHQTSENCNHCGLRKDVPKLDRSPPPKPEPVTTDSAGLGIRTLEARSPSFYAPRVTEFQKQRALSMATELSKTIKNPNALVVGRVSMSEPNGCFLSNMCSEMLPSAPTEFTLMDTEGNAQRVNWKPNQRIMNGPGWKDFVGSHNLHADDFWVMEVVDSSDENVVVKAHIFRSHEMERSLEQQPPAVRTALVPAGPAKTPAVPVAPVLLPVLGTPAPVLGTGAKTRSSNQLHNSVASPSKANKRTRASNMDESAELAGSPRLCATNTTEHDRALLELARPSPIKRPRRGSSSSPSTPRRGTDSTPTSGTGEEPSRAAKPAKPVRKVKQQASRRHSLYTPHAQRKAMAAEAAAATTRRGGASQSASKAQLRSRSTTAAADELADNPKQVRTRNSQKTHYKVSKVLDRRKSLQGVVFLVELSDRVRPESLQQKRMKAQQDEKGRWWVPHHHFNHNLSACYLE